MPTERPTHKRCSWALRLRGQVEARRYNAWTKSFGDPVGGMSQGRDVEDQIGAVHVGGYANGIAAAFLADGRDVNR
jgi:hypothetical protein